MFYSPYSSPIHWKEKLSDLEKFIMRIDKCDVCGQSGTVIYRTTIPYANTGYVVFRHHSWCDPYKAFEERFKPFEHKPKDND